MIMGLPTLFEKQETDIIKINRIGRIISPPYPIHLI